MRLGKGLFLAVFTLLLLGLTAAAPFRAGSLDGVVQPHLFSLVRWEASGLAGAAASRLKYAFAPQGGELLLAYLKGDSNAGEGLEPLVAREIARLLREEGINPFPPILFRFGTPPLVLVTSPRERIQLLETRLLQPHLSEPGMEALERQVESALGVSALVEGTGGVATYPSLIPGGSSPQDALSTIAHEWLHQFLFLRPLGRTYGKNNEMTTVNESVADLAGKEIARLVLGRYGIPFREAEVGDDPFRREMGLVRLEVDRLLGEGRVAVAEGYMEASRLRLEGLGYRIRKLNQAYFAFHGTYADDPAASTPIGEELERLREQAGSLGEFLRQVSRLSSYEELRRLLY